MMIKGCFLISLLPSRAVHPAAAGILRWCTPGLEQWIGVVEALAGLHAWMLKVPRSSPRMMPELRPGNGTPGSDSFWEAWEAPERAGALRGSLEKWETR